MTIKEENQRYYILARVALVLHAATGELITLIDKGNEIIIDHCNGKAQRACGQCDSSLELACEIMNAAHHGKYFDYGHSREEETYED